MNITTRKSDVKAHNRTTPKIMSRPRSQQFTRNVLPYDVYLIKSGDKHPVCITQGIFLPQSMVNNLMEITDICLLHQIIKRNAICSPFFVDLGTMRCQLTFCFVVLIFSNNISCYIFFRRFNEIRDLMVHGNKNLKTCIWTKWTKRAPL